jgi:predicted RNA-binding protein with PIN domain
VAAVDRGGITQEQTPEMFTVLYEEETETLAQLLEKLANHWMELAPQKPHHHGGHSKHN